MEGGRGTGRGGAPNTVESFDNLPIGPILGYFTTARTNSSRSNLVDDVGRRDELEELDDGEDRGHARDKDKHRRSRRAHGPRHLHRQAVLDGQDLLRGCNRQNTTQQAQVCLKIV